MSDRDASRGKKDLGPVQTNPKTDEQKARHDKVSTPGERVPASSLPGFRSRFAGILMDETDWSDILEFTREMSWPTE